jgi:hypothetical protein
MGLPEPKINSPYRSERNQRRFINNNPISARPELRSGIMLYFRTAPPRNIRPRRGNNKPVRFFNEVRFPLPDPRL